MGQRSWDQATGLLNLIKQTGWDGDMVQVLFKNWDLYREVTEALRDGRITSDSVRMFLNGKEKPELVGGRAIDIRPFVEMLIKAGYHEAAGLSASAYRKLWPKTVVQPLEYAGRFDAVLLVDRSIAIP